MDKLDYKKEYKDLYLPKTKPAVVTVPEMTFLMVDGRGNPNDAEGEYQRAIGALYALSYTIKMSKLGKAPLEGYFDYVVPPLEGQWWLDDQVDVDFTQKSKFCWTSMIRQPEFVTPAVFAWACDEVRLKKPEVDISKARLETLTEGLCVQCMHIGVYDDEPATIAKMEAFIVESGLQNDISETRHHHEIYMGDPRKGDPAKRKTVLRIPVKRG